ncbi:secreted RxLR effector protein 161-like [Apis laboriosa]|uniref:secreted RxLR effector protein 161-like n=1 Tax=Apis laboriosa TaxID=183418 RepID=UPI001CC4C9E3|nr:secreted RxLR effector protein 161-like [Apis laboriosa]
MYLSVGTRPDITFAVNKVSQYLEKSNKIHWNAVKRIFKYLKGTTKYGIHYSTQQNNHIKAFSDADYAGDTETRKSTTSFVLKLGDSAIAWGSTRQQTVGLFTTEAEYIAVSQTVKEIIWMKSLINNLVMFKNITTTLYVDNLSAIKLIKNPEFHRKSKHIDVRYHFIRNKFKEKEFLLQHIALKDQQADLLTKPLRRTIFEIQRNRLNIKSIEDMIDT